MIAVDSISDKLSDLKNNLKTFVKSQKQKSITKANWQKYRSHYMMGINSYNRRSILDKDKTLGFLNTLLKKKRNGNIRTNNIDENTILLELSTPDVSKLLTELVILERDLFNNSSNLLHESVEYELLLEALLQDFATFKYSLINSSVPKELLELLKYLSDNEDFCL